MSDPNDTHEPTEPIGVSEPATPPAPERTVRVTHLVFGLVFLGIAGIWALDAGEVLDWTASRYLGPAILVGAGLIGLVAMLATARGRRGTRPEEVR